MDTTKNQGCKMSDAIKCPICQYVYQVCGRENWGVCTNCGENNDKLNPLPEQIPELVDFSSMSLHNRKTHYGIVKPVLESLLQDVHKIPNNLLRFMIQRKLKAIEGIMTGDNRDSIALFLAEADWYEQKYNHLTIVEGDNGNNIAP